jgi:hypothetical protein
LAGLGGQPQLNGTGFVKATGTTISYDNSTYLTTASAAASYQPLDADLTTIAGLTATTDNFMVATSSAWASRTPTQARTQLGLGTLATQSGTFSGTSSGTNTGDQTSIVGITGTKAQYNTSCTDGDFLYVGDVTSFTDEAAQDATGAMVANSTFVNLAYVDATPSLTASLSASGTPSSSTFLRGDNTWTSPTATISDGDKGDVVVSSSGTVFSVESATNSFSRLNSIYPTQITSNQNDYAPTGFSTATVIYINTDLDTRSITGIAGGADGREVTFINNGSFKCIFSNESASSTAANRIHAASSFSISPDIGFVTFHYEGGSMNRWRPIAWNTGAGGVLAGNYPAPSFAAGAVTNAAVTDVAESKITFTAITTGDVTSTKHGFAPVSPADAALFLNGAATPAYALPTTKQFLAITSDQTSTSTSAADVPGLASFSLVAGKTYYFDFELMVTTNATTIGMLCSVNNSTAVTSINAISQVPITATTFFCERISALDGGTLQLNGPGATLQPYRISGNVVANTAGTFALRFKSETGAAVVVKAGSYGYVERLN